MTERMLVSTTETTYGYVYDGGQLSQVTITTTVTADDETTTQTDVLSFTYDASGAPQTVTCGENTYLYVTNLQGDVVAILDNAGTSVVEYTYDAWGNLLNTMGSMANALGAHNPLRYRGYVYDTETGFYYLQSRYYDPELSRFINADALVSTGQGSLGNNMFAYCGNNPISRADFAGHAFVQMAYGFSDHLSLLCPALGGGGGGGYAYAYAGAAASAGANLAKKVKDTIYNTSVTSVQANLQENGVAFYKGVPVFMADLAPFNDSAFSFGIIVMDDYYESASYASFSRVLNHEQGHTTHHSQIGVPTYVATVAIPSLIGAGLTYISPFIKYNYESLPWENIAEQFGGVNGEYLPGATTIGAVYWMYTMLVSWVC